MIPEIRISDYDYDLPEERIAKYPLQQRDSSRLLKYEEGRITEHSFREITDFIPDSSVMVFNDTKVVPARLHFQRPTGAHIEIFCLEPVQPSEYAQIFARTRSCRWKCIVGNVKRWKSGMLSLYNPGADPSVAELDLQAELVERDNEISVVEFTWSGGHPFSRVLEICGTVPIPPYLNRESEAVDTERYQTLYARFRGSVAAPTAGLHFAEAELEAIRKKGVDMETVCLHVGAGTFLPVKSDLISGHRMHREPFIIRKELIRKLMDPGKKVVAVGTTSVRTLETVADEKGMLHACTGDTSIFLYPPYKMKCVDALITNFHLPESTLIMLVSAFYGYDKTMAAYKAAVEERYRFFSFGDAMLIL